MDLLQLQQRHAQERQNLQAEQQQAQEHLQQRQQHEFQEQQSTFFQMQQKQVHQPTLQREHDLLMLQQALVHAETLYLQQQQHLLHTQHLDRERMQERQWHEEQLLMQQLQHSGQPQQQQQQQQQQQHLQHQHSTPHSPHSPQSPQQHSSQLIFPSQPSNPSQQQQQQHGYHTQHHHHQQSPLHQSKHYHPSQQQQNGVSHNNTFRDEDAMDVDDETQINSITSTISNLRHSMPADIDSISSWASSSGLGDAKGDDGDPHAIVILDTNVLISHLNFIQSLISAHGTSISDNKKSLSRPGSPQEPQILFIIPWVVIRELDGLKGGGRGGGSEVDLSEKARRAIRYVHDEMEKPADRRKLRGQKISECMEKQDQNDDYILDCCRYFQTAYPNAKKTRVNLFSNDRNLCVKALIHDITPISREKVNFEIKTVLAAILGQKEQKEAPPSQPSTQDHMMLDEDDDMMYDASASSSSTKDRPTLSRSNSSGVSIVSKDSRGNYRTEVNERELQRIKSGPRAAQIPPGMDPNLFNLATHVIKNLRRYFEVAVPDHLKATFGSDWKKITDYHRTIVKEEDQTYECKRLAQPVHLVLRHWPEVFAELYGNSERAYKAKTHMNKVQLFVKSWDRVETFGLGKVYKKDLVAFLNDVDVVLVGLMTKPAKTASSSSSSIGETEHAKFYDASSRIRLMKDWRAHCNALAD
ncbi:hypothetical protein BGZ83_002283 [Gryganskiella cystojenkinii]|nr:hypothetical protein BGZ83_002283 [Gryganskiella cystojenkinii]